MDLKAGRSLTLAVHVGSYGAVVSRLPEGRYWQVWKVQAGQMSKLQRRETRFI